MGDLNRLQHTAMAEATAPNVVDFSTAWLLKKVIKSIDQVVTVDVIAHLFALVTENRVRRLGNGAFN